IAVFLVVTYLTYRLAKTWVPVRHIAPGQAVRPHRVLIAPISLFKPVPEKNENSQWCVRERDRDGKILREVVLSGKLGEDIAAFSRQGWLWNGQQFLRGLAPHLQGVDPVGPVKTALTDLVLIGSSGEERSSHASLPVVRDWVATYTDARLHPLQGAAKGINFEEIQTLQHTFDKWIRYFIDHGIPESEIILDTTGGQKTTSIAAALTTLRWSQVEFQYVESKDAVGNGAEAKPNVLGFNVVVDAPQHGSR
ncbi:MAG TPA: hypothetical protein VES73_06795, partial [Lamprocystis sp. (in: g-proteobacteria)]|nr:hypothetical protein [Lamprocystis sp. (in: g-proteobacteria)]